MIHDMILSLLHLNENKSFKNFLISNTSKEFLHQSEHKILENIIEIADQQLEIAQFVHKYKSRTVFYNVHCNDIHEEPLQKGMYLQALADGIDLCLQPYRNAMIELEQRFLRTPTYSIMFLFTELNRFDELLRFLLKFISGIRSQRFASCMSSILQSDFNRISFASRLHGCAVLHYLNTNSLNGNKQIINAIEIVQRSVHSVFIKQLSEWVIYGELNDKYGEFFIQHIEQKNASDRQINSVQTTLSDAATSVNTNLWRYEICYEMLPNYLTPTWAGEVLFLGQTVVMFNIDRREIEKHIKKYKDDERNDMTDIGSLWDNQNFIQRFQDLHTDNGESMLKLVELVEEIKIFVSEKLTQIAFKQADLIKQLKLIKDFYMLGRGELFLEFVKQTQSMQNAVLDENVARNVTRAFQNAANSVNVVEDLDHFTLNMQLDETDSISLDIRGIFRCILLKYNVQWPLHLLFSPKVMERYNELFRFLLQIKRIQYDLQTVWCYHREKKITKFSPMLQFRNQLMFLVDNLQYYLQVDVLESQYSILMDTVQKSKDFEHIQRAHTVFQANVMSLCFLLHGVDTSKTLQSTILHSNENPVFIILNQLMGNVCKFCDLSVRCSDPLTDSEKNIFSNCESMVNENVKDLMKLLIGWKAGASSAPLNQLLLRLDYNHYYSSQHGENNDIE